MYKPNRSVTAGTSLAALTAIAIVGVATTTTAQTVATVNGVEISQLALDEYLQNRTQKPLEQITAEERAAVSRELQDIYLLSTQPRAEELAKDATLQAQLELQKRAILAQSVVADWLENNPATEEEIVAAYNDRMQQAPDLQYKARHILVETQGAASDLISQLDDGADFAELATANSTGPSGPSGGDLGWFSPDQMVPPFSAAVEALENGQYTKEPVQTTFGWHVILREDSRNNEPPPLDSVRDAVKQGVEQEKFQAYLESLRSS